MKVIMIIIALVILGLLVSVITVMAKSKKKRPTDYYALFVLGIIWMPVGIATGNHAFTAIGLVFALLGIFNKDKWKKNRRRLEDMNGPERKLYFGIMIVLGLLVLAGLVALILAR